MEAPQLRQLGVGDIVDRVFALYRSRPWLFVALAAVPYLLLTLIIFGVSVAMLGLASTRLSALTQLVEDLSAQRTPDLAFVADVAASLIGFVIVLVIVAVVLLSAQSAALVDAMGATYLGRTRTLSGAFATGLRAAPRVIAAGVLVFLMFVVLWIALAIVMVAANEVLVVLAAVLLGLVATTYIFASALIAPVVATLEGAGPVQALRRSWRLSSGNRWRIIGMQLLLGILNIVISTLLSAVLVGAITTDAGVRSGLQTILNAIATIAWAPIQWGTFTILYYDLRVRHEAYDLQLAAEALPREP